MDTSACIKEVNRSASVAFAPEAPFIAAGTMAGAVDMSFSSSANLAIFQLDFQSDDRKLPLVGATPISEPFNRLSWGKSPTSGSDEFSLGLVAGGLVDGTIGIWNPRILISPKENENALVQQLTRHKGPVRGLEFSGLSPNHLASGAEEGEICIWDISKPSEPTHFPPLKGSASAKQGEISFLSWNRKVQPILASCSFNGTTVVWDLRKQKPIISFSDSVRRRCSVLQWHPDFATQLIVASDDDSSPSLRIWDMRNTMSPLRELVGHNKGVVAMSWCPSDSSYLLTCAKDNRTICWDTGSGEIVSELPAGTNWNFDVHWYPKIPGIISASSFDGKVGIYNIEACARYGTGENYYGQAPLKAPKWYQRKAGVSFGFGGKLVSFHTTGSSGPSEVNVHDLVTEHNLVSTSTEFEDAMRSGDRSNLRVLCDKKSQESESEDDRETWGFLKVMFEDDGTARTKLLHHLGFTLPVEPTEPVQEVTQDLASLNFDAHDGTKDGFAGEVQTLNTPTDYGEDFFNNLPSPKCDTPVSTPGRNEELVSFEDALKEGDGTNDPTFNEAVQRALVVGDYKGAVAQCIAADKMADALVIAQVGGASLWETTRDQYLKKNRSPYLKVVAAMVNNDLVSLVNTRPLKSWKETLALLCTFAQREEWTLLCDTLASRLVGSGNTLAATLCYICAGNIDKTVEIWSKNVTTEHKGESYVDLLQDLMEKTVVLALATGQKRFSASLCKLVEKYAEILASQGLLTTAMEYLKLMGTEDLSPELVILRDRIALSSQPEKEVNGTAEFVHSQPQMGNVYGGNQQTNSVVEPARNYYQDESSYQRESYQQPAGPMYNTQYQQPQQPSLFVPSPAAHIPPTGFNPPPVTTQPVPKGFVPSTPPVMRNADQYQQPPTLGSQLSPSQVNPNLGYQSGPPGPGSLGPVPSLMVPATGPKISQGVSPPVRGVAEYPQRKQYVGTLPMCDKCDYRHLEACRVWFCDKGKRKGHNTSDCQKETQETLTSFTTTSTAASTQLDHHVGTLPMCDKCIHHHTDACRKISCSKCKRKGHTVRSGNKLVQGTMVQKTDTPRKVNKKRKFENKNKGRSNQGPQKKQEIVAVYAATTTVIPTLPKQYAGTLPKCGKCNYHHTGACRELFCNNCKRKGHIVRFCRNPAQGTAQASTSGVSRACFRCRETGHFKRDCPKAKAHGENGQGMILATVKKEEI